MLFIVNGGNDEARLGLLAVHNFYTPFLFFLRKTALRQVVHRDVTRPHFVRSSHLPKSAELAKAILTTFNSAIKKSHTRWLLLMAGTTRLELATSCVTGMRSNQTELRSHIKLSFVNRIVAQFGSEFEPGFPLGRLVSYAPILNCHRAIQAT